MIIHRESRGLLATNVISRAPVDRFRVFDLQLFSYSLSTQITEIYPPISATEPRTQPGRNEQRYRFLHYRPLSKFQIRTYKFSTETDRELLLSPTVVCIGCM